MAAANDLRRGMAIKYNGNAAIVLEVHHRTPGNLRAFVQAIIRYINTGKSADVRFGSTDKVELVDIERKQPRVQLQRSQRLSFHGPGNLRYRYLAGEFDRRRTEPVFRGLVDGLQDLVVDEREVDEPDSHGDLLEPEADDGEGRPRSAATPRAPSVSPCGG